MFIKANENMRCNRQPMTMLFPSFRIAHVTLQKAAELPYFSHESRVIVFAPVNDSLDQLVQHERFLWVERCGRGLKVHKHKGGRTNKTRLE